MFKCFRFLHALFLQGKLTDFDIRLTCRGLAVQWLILMFILCPWYKHSK